MEADPSSVLICEGFRGAALLLAVTMAGHGGRVVALENPSLPGADLPWRASGWQVVDLPVDDAGARVETLASGVDAVVLTPSHQFPRGGTLSPSRRRQVVEWASRTGAVIVEDDYDGEFRYDRHPVPALQRSAPAHVVYVGSVSKTLDRHLRLGWIVAPPTLMPDLRRTAADVTGGAPLLNQLALAQLVTTGDFERHVRRQRREYARRSLLLRGALAELGYGMSSTSAGLHARIPVRVPTDDLGDTVAVHGIGRYLRGEGASDALVVGFGTPSRGMFEPAMHALVGELGRRRLLR